MQIQHLRATVRNTHGAEPKGRRHYSDYATVPGKRTGSGYPPPSTPQGLEETYA
jgi:hypothetical protein